jgi:hypothetical protein
MLLLAVRLLIVSSIDPNPCESAHKWRLGHLAGKTPPPRAAFLLQTTLLSTPLDTHTAPEGKGGGGGKGRGKQTNKRVRRAQRPTSSPNIQNASPRPPPSPRRPPPTKKESKRACILDCCLPERRCVTPAVVGVWCVAWIGVRRE